MDQFRDYEGTWEKLSQVAVNSAEHDSRERQPHPKCLEGTRVVLLNHTYELLDNQEMSGLVWLHGTAGVGKSAVAFTVAERMKRLKVTEGSKEKRLAGTFFFSRKHTKRCTTGYFFATLAYQLASTFPTVRDEVNGSILENPALLDPDKSLHDQMEALFLRPLRRLQLRLRECPPLAFVIDALDECASESEIADLISLLGEALREPDLPVIHILLTSRSEEHIRKSMQREEMRPLVCEIPVQTSGEGVAATISLDGADVDYDIYLFLQHSFRDLETRHPDFPQPSSDEFARLASRAGRRFIVASTMVKFIDDRDHDPRDQLQLMLELTSKLLPGTEVFKLYDRILLTCADPALAYMHLSVVAALADPLPMSQISKLLGPGQGRHVETVLAQLRSIIDVPIDSSLSVNIYHSSVRDYVSDSSNSSIPNTQSITSPHSLLALSSLQSMLHDIPENTDLLDALLALRGQSRAMQHHQFRNLKHSPIIPLRVPLQRLIARLLPRIESQPWITTLDGCAWLQTKDGLRWLRTRRGKNWLETEHGQNWLRTAHGQEWLKTYSWRDSLEHRPMPQIQSERKGLHVSTSREGLHTPTGRKWLRTSTGREWLQTLTGHAWLHTSCGREWLQTSCGKEWLHIKGGQGWLQTEGGRWWVQTGSGRGWLNTVGGQEWLQSWGGREWIQTLGGRDWLQTRDGREWIQNRGGQDWLQTRGGRDWLQTRGGRDWLQTQNGQDWLQTPGGQGWLQAQGGQDWLQTRGGRDWLQTRGGQDWLQIQDGQDWLQTQGGQGWLQTQGGQDWLQTPPARKWLQTVSGRDWLETRHGQAWQSTPAASVWLTMEDFSSISEAIDEFTVAPDLRSQPTFRAIEEFQSLPDFLKLPVFLAFRDQDHSMEDGSLPDRETIRAMTSFATFANEARTRSRSGSDALTYACQNWAFHLSGAPKPWDDTLNHTFTLFWNNYLLSWLERQWCLKGLRSCLIVLSEGQKNREGGSRRFCT